MSREDIQDAVLEVLGAAAETLTAEEIHCLHTLPVDLVSVRVALRDLREKGEVSEDGSGGWTAEPTAPTRVSGTGGPSPRSVPPPLRGSELPQPDWTRPAGQTQDELWKSFAAGLARRLVPLPESLPMDLLIAAH